jgi:hypothetical protein
MSVFRASRMMVANVPRAAVLCGLSRATLYRWIKIGLLSSTGTDEARRVLLAEVELVKVEQADRRSLHSAEIGKKGGTMTHARRHGLFKRAA